MISVSAIAFLVVALAVTLVVSKHATAQQFSDWLPPPTNLNAIVLSDGTHCPDCRQLRAQRPTPNNLEGWAEPHLHVRPSSSGRHLGRTQPLGHRACQPGRLLAEAEVPGRCRE